MPSLIFLDTNALIDLLSKGGRWKEVGVFLNNNRNRLCTSMVVISELRHKFILQYAAKIVGGYKKHEIVKRIKNDRKLRVDAYKKYTKFFSYMASFVHIYDLSKDYEPLSSGLSIKYGLLGNDATILATMLKNDVSEIMTYDDDFRRITGIKVVRP